MHDVYQLALGPHDIVDRLVRGRRFVNPVGVFAAFDTFGRFRVVFQRKALLRSRARHLATRVMAARTEALGVSLSANDERFGAHTTGNDAELAFVGAQLTAAQYWPKCSVPSDRLRKYLARFDIDFAELKPT